MSEEDFPPLPEELIYVEVARLADKMTKTILAGISRKFFAKLSDDMIPVEAILRDSVEDGHLALLRMIFNGYKDPKTRFHGISNQLFFVALVNGQKAVLEFLLEFFDSSQLENIFAETNIGKNGHWEMFEFLKLHKKKNINYLQSYHGACLGRKIDFAQKVLAEWKDKVEAESDSMVFRNFCVNAITSAVASGSLEIFNSMKEYIPSYELQRILEADITIMATAIESDSVDLIEELFNSGVERPSNVFRHAKSKKVIALLAEKDCQLNKDFPTRYLAVKYGDLHAIDTLYHMGARFEIDPSDVPSYEVLMWLIENLGQVNVRIVDIVFKLMSEAAVRDDLELAKKSYSALFYSEVKLSNWNIEVISDKAARNGSLNVYKWLFQEELLNHCSGFHLGVAVSNNQFSMVKFIAEKDPQAQREIPQKASNYGHMRMLKWAIKSGFATSTWAIRWLSGKENEKYVHSYFNPNFHKIVALLNAMLKGQSEYKFKEE